MMKHSKRFLCLLLTLILAASLCVFPAAAADQTCPSSKDDPVVFVHGLMGWGEHDQIYSAVEEIEKGVNQKNYSDLASWKEITCVEVVLGSSLTN